MKLTDYVIEFLVGQNIDTVFGLTGGAAVHFFDSADKSPEIQPIFCHHEQAAALAAVSYARSSNRIGAAIFTTGPGGTNAITGVTAAWQDSIPCFFISGQSRKDHTTHGKTIRQLGSQELDIVSIVKPITNYAVMVEAPEQIRYHLEKALYLAKSKRPGPVWLDIPLNFQWASVEHDKMFGFTPDQKQIHPCTESYISEACQRVVELLGEMKRPLMLAGYGVRLAGAEDLFLSIVEKMQIPFVATWAASDMFTNNHPLYMGRSGVAGQRGANLALQNCDLLLAVGSHLSIPLTGTIFKAFAREAKIIVVDIDQNELNYETVRIDLPICCDAKIFLNEMEHQLQSVKPKDISIWKEYCKRYAEYNQIPKTFFDQREYVNPYVFIETLSDLLNGEDTIVVDGGGTNVYITFQSFQVKKGQRLLLSTGICAMGTGLPESVGACFSRKTGRTICLCGDGSLQLNIQELQTIVHHNLNVKIFVMNNGGYLAIRHTQDGFLNSNYVGSDANGGLSLPDYKKVAQAYDMQTCQISGHNELTDAIQKVLQRQGPVLCEVIISPTQELLPRQGFEQKADGTYVPRPLEDMYPLLDRDEFNSNMIVKPWGAGE